MAAGLEEDSPTMTAAIESLDALDVCLYACVNVDMRALYCHACDPKKGFSTNNLLLLFAISAANQVAKRNRLREPSSKDGRSGPANRRRGVLAGSETARGRPERCGPGLPRRFASYAYGEALALHSQ